VRLLPGEYDVPGMQPDVAVSLRADDPSERPVLRISSSSPSARARRFATS
jgi:hypothetical protein